MGKNKIGFAGYLKIKGWTVEHFVQESMRRGFALQVGTTYRWHNGVLPKTATRENLKRIFPDIKF